MKTTLTDMALHADEWPVAPPEDVGLDSAPLGVLERWLGSFAEANVHGVVVIRHGALAYERYFAGEDQNWGQPLGRISFASDSKHDLRSVTKSVTSLLVGIALDRGLIGDIDEPLFTFFPEHADLRTEDKDRILLRHLLTMSSGLEWDEYRPYTDPLNSEIRMIWSPDRYRFALERGIAAPPGTLWNYNSGSSELLGAIISKAAGRPLEDFAKEALFDPLGIRDVAWSTYPNNDIVSSGGGLRLRPRDMAKIGQLVLNRGQWAGRQIVPANWIDASVAAQMGPTDRKMFYGYQWWLGRSLIDRQEIAWVAAMGLGGQRIFAVPAFDLVTVVTAGDYEGTTQQWVPTVILNRYVFAAIKGKP
jgi:CubicO group peptidase (beta-lactamase class C family)